MQKAYFDNNKSFNENKSQKKTIPSQYFNKKRIVDINKLLNRIRIDKRNETKRKIIFYSSTVLGLYLVVMLMMALK